MQPLRSFNPRATVLSPVAIARRGDDDKKVSVTVARPTASAKQSQAEAEFCKELARLKSVATHAQASASNSTVEDTKKAQASGHEKVRAADRAVQEITTDKPEAAVVKLDAALAAVSRPPP